MFRAGDPAYIDEGVTGGGCLVVRIAHLVRSVAQECVVGIRATVVAIGPNRPVVCRILWQGVVSWMAGGCWRGVLASSLGDRHLIHCRAGRLGSSQSHG